MSSGLLVPTGRLRWRSIRRRRRSVPREAPGRPVGHPEGSWIADLVALRKAIILCRTCDHRFDPDRHHYYKDRKFPFVQGRCDGCRQFAYQGRLHIHESALADPGGKLRSGQVWTPV